MTGVPFTLIKAARFIDGTGASVLERGAVLIEGDRIRAVGGEESVHAPEGAQVQELDYGDRTVLPGLVDCHVHLNGIGDGRRGDDLVKLPDEVLAIQSAENARRHLLSGVTTIRDCGAKNRTTFTLRQAMDDGLTVGPRLVLAGRPVAIVGGHLSYFGIQATGPDECRAAVRQLVKEGADFIKITATGGSTMTSFPLLPSFTVPELKAIIEEAHKFGKHAAAHCASSQGMVNCLDAGIDTIIHGVHREPDGSQTYRPEISERIAEQGVFVNPTLNGAREGIKALETKAARTGLTGQEQARLDQFRRGVEARADHVARMREAGVRMVCGSDSAWGRHTMGHFHDEIHSHVQAGMSPMEAIVSATGDSARSCWVEDRVGTLEEGKLADVLVVDGDPSQDVMALANVAGMFLGGEKVDRVSPA